MQTCARTPRRFLLLLALPVQSIGAVVRSACAGGARIDAGAARTGRVRVRVEVFSPASAGVVARCGGDVRIDGD